jgi:hypothetical protein
MAHMIKLAKKAQIKVAKKKAVDEKLIVLHPKLIKLQK